MKNALELKLSIRKNDLSGDDPFNPYILSYTITAQSKGLTDYVRSKSPAIYVRYKGDLVRVNFTSSSYPDINIDTLPLNKRSVIEIYIRGTDRSLHNKEARTPLYLMGNSEKHRKNAMQIMAIITVAFKKLVDAYRDNKKEKETENV